MEGESWCPCFIQQRNGSPRGLMATGREAVPLSVCVCALGVSTHKKGSCARVQGVLRPCTCQDGCAQACVWGQLQG